MININRRLALTGAVLTLAGGLAAGTVPHAAAAPAVSRAASDSTPASASASASAPRATLSDVQIGVRRITRSSAGSNYADLTFRNVGRHAVSIHGYAGVSVVAHHDGTQVGRPAVWLRNRRAGTVVLEPGQQTTEIVSIADAGNYGRGHTVTADGFRVYLPGSRAAAFVSYRFTATTRNVAQLHVDPIGARI